MRFTTLILRNLTSRRVRSSLTILGLAIGIAAVMLLTGVAWGFERSFRSIYTARGIDLVVVRAGISNQLSSNLDIGMQATLREISGVAQIAPSLMDTVAFEDANIVSVLANGWVPESLLFRGIRVLDGRALRSGDDRSVMLGRILALNLGKAVGADLDIAGEAFRVVGIFESESLFENGGLIVPLEVLQRMMGREGQVTGFVIRTEYPEDAEAVRSLAGRIEQQVRGVAAVPARDYIQGDVQIRLAKSMAWVTTLVALILGSVGMLNTMVMAVFERTGEIGLLRAVGWRRSRVIRLILGEALVLGLGGAFLGTILAFLGVQAILLEPSSRGFIDPKLPPAVIAIGLAMGVGLTVLGGIYPALRAAALEPTEALRHD